MNENAPCKGCTIRHPTCHGSCEAYKGWLERDHAQKEHLKEMRHRFAIPRSEARDKKRGFI